MTTAFEAHAVDIPTDDQEHIAASNLSRRSARWERRMLRQPSSVIVIRSTAGPPRGADAGGAAEDGSAETPLLLPRHVQTAAPAKLRMKHTSGHAVFDASSASPCIFQHRLLGSNSHRHLVTQRQRG